LEVDELIIGLAEYPVIRGLETAMPGGILCSYLDSSYEIMASIFWNTAQPGSVC
jgi:hypothetical protein